MRRLASLLMLSIAVGLAGSLEIKPGEAPSMSYEQLGEVVRSYKGKVLLVYFWADY